MILHQTSAWEEIFSPKKSQYHILRSCPIRWIHHYGLRRPRTYSEFLIEQNHPFSHHSCKTQGGGGAVEESEAVTIYTYTARGSSDGLGQSEITGRVWFM